MSQRIGTTVIAPMVINDDNIPYPIAYANDLQGGAQSGPNKNSMFNVPLWNRQFGMFYTVYNDGLNNGTYVLTYGLSSTSLSDNGNWLLFAGNSGGGNGVAKKIDKSIIGTGTIQAPANSLLIVVIIGAPIAGAQTFPNFNVGLTPGGGEIVATQEVVPSLVIGPGSSFPNSWNVTRFCTTATTIYFSGVDIQSTCSIIVLTF